SGPGTTSGGGGAKASASCPAGSRHALTPRSTAATSASAPSGVAATTVTGRAKSSVQRGARAAPGLPPSATQPCTGTPAAPAPPAVGPAQRFEWEVARHTDHAAVVRRVIVDTRPRGEGRGGGRRARRVAAAAARGRHGEREERQQAARRHVGRAYSGGGWAGQARGSRSAGSRLDR